MPHANSVLMPMQANATTRLAVALSTMLGDSEAVFSSRANAVGLSEDVVRKFKAASIDTMAKYAFCCNYNPGGSDDKPFKDVVTKILGRDPSLVEESCLRRLFNEAFATVASDIKAQTEQSEESATRKLAPADRAARLEEQQQRLVGIEIRGPYEPGDSLVDRLVGHYESDRLQYTEWSACVSREHELLGGNKKDQRLVVQASGELKLSSSHKVDPCDTSSEILLRYALTRRGLAMEQANIMSYRNHNQWVEKLLSCRLETPPAGFAKVTFQQLEAADKRLFVLISEKTRSGIKATPSGRPCDTHFQTCMSSTEVLSLLQPKPIAVKGKDDVEPPPKKHKVERPQTKGRGKTNSKGKQTQFMRVPAELLSLGCVACTPQGSRICFSSNLKKCTLKVVNQRCEKGLHICAICFKQHAALDCPNKRAE